MRLRAFNLSSMVIGERLRERQIIRDLAKGEFRMKSAWFSCSGRIAWLVLIVGCTLVAATPAPAQSTIATGSIQVTISDPSGAVVQGAKVTILNKDTGQSLYAATTSAGAYNAGALVPGNYTVRTEAKGFKTVETSVVVQVGVVSGVNLTLQVGSASTVVEVAAQTVIVNTEQPTVQGVLNKQQIENLPVNGRNFLDLAQLEPGVQIQDGADFDPTKVGFSSISFGGRFGRTARIEVDGVDVSDETVGTTTENIPSSAIEEFQISQSTLDLSNELTSSGSVNVVTRSGTNTIHGEAFGLFRDSVFSAALPGPPAPYQRSQFGGNLGGPIIKDKLFFFLDAERTKQDLFAPVITAQPLDSFTGGFNAPFRETDLVGRLDWQVTNSLRVFYRPSYFSDKAVSAGGAVGYQPYQDKNHTRSQVAGADFNTGGFTHSIRFEYLKFINDLSDAVLGTNLPFANFPVSINIGSLGFFTGPNFLAPQQTFQTNRQIKYDGSKIWGFHTIRYGFAYNRLRGGGFASFSSITANVFPAGTAQEITAAASGPFPGGAGNPRNYPVDTAQLGNGLGFSSEIPAFGLPAGGLVPDNRIGLYVGDSWKIKPNFNLTFGVRYGRDSGRTDSDLPPLDALNGPLPGLGNRVNQPNLNFGPQLGIAWDPWKNGKTVIRAGAGIFYENALWNNSLFDRPERLPTGGFLANPTICSNGQITPIPFPDGTLQSFPGSCADFLGNQAAAIAAFQQSYINASKAVGTTASNPSYIPNLITSASAIPLGALAPDYVSPRSIQINAGIQHELRPGLILSIDYLRNIATHYLIGIDANHSGDVRYFDKTAAHMAITNTINACMVPSVDAAIAACPGLHPATAQNPTPGPATIADFASFGLDSAADLGVGSCQVALGFSCAFPGVNPALGPAILLFPGGRSVYNAMDVKLVDNVKDPFRGVKYLNFQFAYSFSRFVNAGGSFSTANGTLPAAADQDYVNPAVDNRNPLAFTGPSALDRTHLLSFGGYADLPLHFRMGTILHFNSPLATTLVIPSTNTGAGEIFHTDFTGDGTTQDVMPGTKVGSFGRSISTAGLSSVINNYNSNVAGQLTPAGQLLLSNGLFTPQQLGVGNPLCAFNPNGVATGALCAVAPAVTFSDPVTGNPSLGVIPGEVGMGWVKAFDLSIAWVGTVNLSEHELSIEPSVSFYNLFNFANFDQPGNNLSGILTGTAGSINGTTPAGHLGQRVGVGTGVFALGAPRTLEFGLKLTF
ncbi:MAG: carboxypeptidase regulatory-like domain-containing protein [Candidatus Acidiferrales bacterium]